MSLVIRARVIYGQASLQWAVPELPHNNNKSDIL